MHPTGTDLEEDFGVRPEATKLCQRFHSFTSFDPSCTVYANQRIGYAMKIFDSAQPFSRRGRRPQRPPRKPMPCDGTQVFRTVNLANLLVQYCCCCLYIYRTFGIHGSHGGRREVWVQTRVTKSSLGTRFPHDVPNHDCTGVCAQPSLASIPVVIQTTTTTLESTPTTISSNSQQLKQLASRRTSSAPSCGSIDREIEILAMRSQLQDQQHRKIQRQGKNNL